jgi:hypothetical protein
VDFEEGVDAFQAMDNLNNAGSDIPTSLLTVQSSLERC